MKNTIKISIPEPCSQKWDKMQAGNNGRFCSSCEKTVVDFTKMDDEGFIAYFQNIKNIPCGRLTERQLSLDIPFKSKPLLPFGRMSKYIAASMITVAGLGGKVFGQNPIVIQTSPNKDEIKKEPSDKTVESELIRGRIIDKDNNGIPGAYIVIESLDLKTTTDVDGFFELSIKKDPKVVFYDLFVMSPELETIKQSINIFTHHEITIIKIDNSSMARTLGGICIYTPTKWQRFKSWIKNNFL